MIEPMPREIINWSILEEIIYMDDDDPDFSKRLASQFVVQADTTFAEICEELKTNKNLEELEKLGHFLKGSAAALGLQRIAWACERIQNLSKKVEKTFPTKEELLSTLPEGTQIYDLDMRTYDNLNKGTPPETDGDELYLFLIKRALALAYLEFKLARIELSAYYHDYLY